MKSYVRIQGSLFGEFNEIEATPIISKRINALLEPFEVIQGTYLDQGIRGMEVKAFTRFMYTSFSRNFVLRIGLSRIDLEVIYNVEKNNIQSTKDVMSLCRGIFSCLLNEFGKLGSRISFISEYIDESGTKSHSDYLKPIDFFKEGVNEWSSRQHKVMTHEINKSVENLNIIYNVGFVMKELSNPNKRISLKGITNNLDINTHQSKMTNRIDAEFVNQFYDYVEFILPELEKEYV